MSEIAKEIEWDWDRALSERSEKRSKEVREKIITRAHEEVRAVVNVLTPSLQYMPIDIDRIKGHFSNALELLEYVNKHHPMEIV